MRSTVYCVEFGEYEQRGILCCFASEPLAEEYAKKHDCVVLALEVFDHLPEPRTRFKIAGAVSKWGIHDVSGGGPTVQRSDLDEAVGWPDEMGWSVTTSTWYGGDIGPYVHVEGPDRSEVVVKFRELCRIESDRIRNDPKVLSAEEAIALHDSVNANNLITLRNAGLPSGD